MKTLILLSLVGFLLSFSLALPFNEDAVDAANTGQGMKNIVNDHEVQADEYEG